MTIYCGVDFQSRRQTVCPALHIGSQSTVFRCLLFEWATGLPEPIREYESILVGAKCPDR